jgi:hypothetical protein
MGNTDSALPTEQPMVQPNGSTTLNNQPPPAKLNGIPPIVKCEESRSVLEEEKEVGSSLFSLTVLPSHRRIIRPPGSDKTTTSLDKDVICGEDSHSNQVSGKDSRSWADRVKNSLF